MNQVLEQHPIRINEQMVAKSTFIKRYKKSVWKSLQRIDPNISKEQAEKVMDQMILEQGFSPEVRLDNNYTGEYADTTLIAVLDWLKDREPIIAGNATFYKNQHESVNPAAVMLRGLLDERAAIKKQMFKVEDATSRMYKDLDRGQMNKKVGANSYYGGSGAKTSSFYSEYSGPATTLSAQSVIATTENLFESFLADNYNFLDLDELADWLSVVLHEYQDCMDQIEPGFLRPINEEQLTLRLINHVINMEEGDEDLIAKMVSNLDPEVRSFIYYKNNMVQFIDDHSEIQNLFLKVFEHIKNYDYVDKKDKDWLSKIPEEFQEEYKEKSAKDWNSFVSHKYFINPNKPPEDVTKYLDKLNTYMMRHVYVRYFAFDRIYRLKNFTRGTVTVVDTDSNILSLDVIIRYMIGRFFEVDVPMYGRPSSNNEFIAVNIVTYFITNAVTDILLSYGKMSNIPEEYRKYYNMKNEFMFAMLIIGEAKKRYLSSILLREGNVMNPPKVDIKGFDFKKSTTSEYAEEIFTGIIKRNLLSGGDLHLRNMVEEIHAFKQEIIDSILSGDKKFLPNGKANELESYKDPNKLQVVKAMVAWNAINPDNQIEPPTSVSLLKLNIFKPEDIQPLMKTHPDIYKRINETIFQDTTGMFVKAIWVQTAVHKVNVRKKEWWKEIPEKYRKKYKDQGAAAWNTFAEAYLIENGTPEEEGHYKYQYKGLTVLAIPNNSKIPEWCMPYIDMGTMVNTILSPFLPVLEIFKIKTLEQGKSTNSINRKSKGISRFVKF